jgi:RNA polymerase sigma factor (sigma-70 family)
MEQAMYSYPEITGLTQDEFQALFEEEGSVSVAAKIIFKKFSWTLKRLRIERKDFIQEMFAAFLSALPDFNPGMGSISTFAQVTIRNHATKYIRDQGALCRDPRRVKSSLDNRVPLTGRDRTRHFKFQTGGHYARQARRSRRPSLPFGDNLGEVMIAG